MSVRKPYASEYPLLSELALKSKAYWGYDPNFIEACRNELTVTKDDPAIIYVYEQGGKPVGVFSFLKQTSWYLDFFYIDVSTIGSGYGRKMWHEMIACAKKENISSFLIESDPNAEPFYKKMGAHRIGETPSSVFSNRMLPLLKVDVS